MKNADVIIIGAGAAGLMTAFHLSKAGKQVLMLEARNRTGGRIHTIYDEPFSSHVELGAEFVHGDLPVTLQLLMEAGINVIPATGEMWHFRNGRFSKDNQQMDHWDLLMEKLNELENDTTISNFLQQEFNDDKYEQLREWVIKFASGYDTADVRRASAFALRKEWENEDDGAQHRVAGGYSMMISYLENECKKNGGQLHLNSAVKYVYWENGQVEVLTTSGSSFKAKKLVIALPLGVLQANQSQEGAISISPSVPTYQDAIGQIGFGAIVKILLKFKTAFWRDEAITGIDLNEMSFIISDEEIPTWWTQYPVQSNLLTGWFGGPAAENKKELGGEDLLEQALRSLAHIFNRSVEDLEGELTAWKIVNWTTDQFTLGSYAYDRIGSSKARKILNTPINHTIYFAGEYLYEGPAMGTVEAALSSGLETARKIIG